MTKRQFSLRKRSRFSPFTLLELLVVVAILAIIGGGLIAAYDGLETNAGQGSSARDMAAMDQTVRTFKVVSKSLPDNLETLLQATPDMTGAAVPSVANNLDNVVVGLTAAPSVPSSFIPSYLQAKLQLTNFNANVTLPDNSTIAGSVLLDNLRRAGLTKLRFLDPKGTGAATATLDILAADALAATVGDMSLIDIPQHAFETPRPGSGRNRGRGYALSLGAVGTAVPANLQLYTWKPGSNGYDNVKLAGNANGLFVVLGIGSASSIVGKSSNISLAKAPYYTNVNKNEYCHYLMLVDVTQSPAKFVSVVDTRGGFLDESYAKFTDQNPGI